MNGKRVVARTFLGVVAGVICWLGSYAAGAKRASGRASP
jgi:hypothetical protein